MRYKMKQNNQIEFRQKGLVMSFLLFYLFTFLPLTAQSVYTLEQLKQLAVENNYSLRSARNAIQQSKEQKSEALTKYFPQVSALGFAFQNNKPMIDIDIEMPDLLAHLIPEGLIPANISLMKKGIYGSVSAIQPVFMGGQIINGNKLAKVGVEASELQMEVSADNVGIAEGEDEDPCFPSRHDRAVGERRI